MTSQLLAAIDQVSREKNIEPEIIISAVEDAIIAASKKIFKSSDNFRARFNRTSGELEVWTIREVVEEVINPKREILLDEAQLFSESVELGDQIEFMQDTSKLGRIAAHAAKQVILQKVRDAEKDNIYDEYSQRIGEVVLAVVRRFERGNVIMDLGNNVEAIMHREEQSRAERYSQNDRVRVVIIGADKNSKEPQVKVSRADARLLLKLFEMEVPEIYDQTVVLKNAAREAGDRSKVAVYSTDPDIDPIGACVGMGGSRVKSIIRELKGERLDIVRYSDDIGEFACNALSPARINRVITSDPVNRRLEVIVDEDQLSLAIGKKGQNVRLASKLCGWSIEVKTEEQKKLEAQAEMERMAEESKAAAEEKAAEEASADVTAEAGTEAGAEVEAEAAEVAEPIESTEVASDEPEEEEYEEEGVPLAYLDGMDDETRQILETYKLMFIEDILETPVEVLNEIPELAGKTLEVKRLANEYAMKFGAEEE